MYEVDKVQLSIYVAHQYHKKHSQDISRIMLQKVMYFLYAYWTQKGRGQLFDSNFKSWAFGPVDVDIYELQKSRFYLVIETKEEEADHFELNNETLTMYFINDLLRAAFELSDSRLIELSHSDSCWKNTYDKSISFSDNPITYEMIKETYSKYAST